MGEVRFTRGCSVATAQDVVEYYHCLSYERPRPQDLAAMAVAGFMVCYERTLEVERWVHRLM